MFPSSSRALMMFFMGLFLAWAVLPATKGLAQTPTDQVWVQIEARPDEQSALERAHAWAAMFPETVGYRMASGWYAIALGPYDRMTAMDRMFQLKQENLIPRDSYVAFGSDYLAMFWPVDPMAAPAGDAVGANTAPTPDALPPEPLAEDDLATARADEADLSKPDRQEVQEAMAWAGVYQGKIDGSFGKGTRSAMAAWQAANGHTDTGVLTKAQRAALIDGYRRDIAEFGFAPVTDDEAGISLTLPMGMVAFDSYAPPFAHYLPKGPDGPTIDLISQPGNADGVDGLVALLQSRAQGLPTTADRQGRITRLTGRGATGGIAARLEQQGGAIKGYVVTWPAALAPRIDRILPVIDASFASTGAQALDPSMVPMEDATRQAMLAGLDRAGPNLTRSGIVLDGAGRVLTSADGLGLCARITLGAKDVAARIDKTDAAAGYVILRSEQPLSGMTPLPPAPLPTTPGAPLALAGFGAGRGMPGVAVAYGTLAGGGVVPHLTVPALAGDAGGAVLDTAGRVVGMVLPPDGVGAPARIAPLEGLGVSVPANGPLAPALSTAAVAAQARAGVVTVTCWN